MASIAVTLFEIFGEKLPGGTVYGVGESTGAAKQANGSNAHKFLLDAAGDPGFAGSGEHVHFAAHAELREVDSGLDGEAGVGQDAALVVGFKVVEMRAGAVNLVGDVVAGAVDEEFAEAGVADNGAGGIVGLESVNGAVLCEGVLDRCDGGVAGAADGIKNQLLFF